MKNKSRIILRVFLKALRSLLPRHFYNNRTLPYVVYLLVRYLLRNGPRTTISKAKKEMVRMGARAQNHSFPNGLVSGVNQLDITDWAPKKKVSIVIPSYNDFELLEVCVASIHRTAGPIDYDIIIVDDFCQEENQLKLKTLIDNKTRIIFREQNGGFARAVNTGLRDVPKSNDVVILNSDTEAHEGWLHSLQYAAYGFAQNVGIVGPKLLYPDGRIQSAGSYRNTEATEWFDHYYRFQESNYGPANVPQYCLGVTGACQYITREFIESVGIYDEGFGFAKEDMDLCLRGWEAGYRTLYFPASVLTHHESASRAKNKSISEKEKQSVVYFWEKWGEWFDNRNVRDENGRIRIIYVLQTLGWSGGIKIAVEHVNRLAEEGFSTEIWSLDDNPAWEIKVPTRSFKNYQQLTKELEEQEAIKVATWWETASPVWNASVKKGIAVNFIQELESWFYPDDPDAQRTVVSCYRKEFKNLTTSSYNQQEIEQLGLKATIVPCGYDDKVYRPLKGTKRRKDVLLALGRSFFQKNFDFTLRGWKRLGDKRPTLWLFGSEPEMKSLDEKIRYITKPSDARVNELYNEATVFIQTSRHEGFCLPLLEAMATGAPVICTDAHGNRDFSHDKKTCIMVDHDDDDQLASAIDKLLSDASLRDRLSKNSIKEARKYAWESVTGQLIRFYNGVATQESITKKVIQKYGK